MTLKFGDLIDCIRPDISIDEYESKAGDNSEVIVVAFYAIEEDAAKDLDEFIEKSSIEVVDVDVSPNPTEDGKFMIFVELKRSEDFFEKLFSIVEEVENLSGKLEWRVTTRQADHAIGLNDEALLSLVDIEDVTPSKDDNEDTTVDLKVEDEDGGEDIEMDDVEESIRLFNTNNIISERVDNKVKLRGLYLDIIDCDSEDFISEAYCYLPVDFADPYECKELRKILGLDWEVTKLKECVALKHYVSGNVIIARV